jgi:hypothetical protein
MLVKGQSSLGIEMKSAAKGMAEEYGDNITQTGEPDFIDGDVIGMLNSLYFIRIRMSIIYSSFKV